MLIYAANFIQLLICYGVKKEESYSFYQDYSTYHIFLVLVISQNCGPCLKKVLLGNLLAVKHGTRYKPIQYY